MFLGASARDVPQNVHTEKLQGKIPYVAYPPPDVREITRYDPKCDTVRALGRGDSNAVFVGQLPRLLPLSFIPWAIDLMLGEYGVRWVLQTQTNGCAKAWLDREEQCDTLVTATKTLLFDVCGVWLARTPEERATLAAFQQQLQTSPVLDGRIPRHGMLIERLRPPQPNMNTHSVNNNNNQQQQQQHPQLQQLRPGSTPLPKGPAMLFPFNGAPPMQPQSGHTSLSATPQPGMMMQPTGGRPGSQHSAHTPGPPPPHPGNLVSVGGNFGGNALYATTPSPPGLQPLQQGHQPIGLLNGATLVPISGTFAQPTFAPVAMQHQQQQQQPQQQQQQQSGNALGSAMPSSLEPSLEDAAKQRRKTRRGGRRKKRDSRLDGEDSGSGSDDDLRDDPVFHPQTSLQSGLSGAPESSTSGTVFDRAVGALQGENYSASAAQLLNAGAQPWLPGA